jgi:hypothetical protein
MYYFYHEANARTNTLAKWSPYILNTSTSGSMGLNRGQHKLEIRHKQKIIGVNVKHKSSKHKKRKENPKAD